MFRILFFLIFENFPIENVLFFEVPQNTTSRPPNKFDETLQYFLLKSTLEKGAIVADGTEVEGNT